MGNFNSCTLMGRLTRDPELRMTQNNMAVLSGSLAVNFRVKRGDQWEEEATFIDFKMFGKRAEAFDRFHKRGSEAFLTGRISTDNWEDKQTGQKRSKTYVTATDWEFVGGKSEGGQQSRGRASQGSSSDGWTVDGPGDFLGADETPF